MTAQEAASAAVLEVLEDIAAGTVPDDVDAFSALHDYVDANEYGTPIDVDEARVVQARVNQWLQLRAAARLAGMSVRDHYSGRFMYGRRCLGFVGDDSQMAKLWFALGLAGEQELYGELVSQMRTDDMGLQTIYYFPEYPS